MRVDKPRHDSSPGGGTLGSNDRCDSPVIRASASLEGSHKCAIFQRFQSTMVALFVEISSKECPRTPRPSFWLVFVLIPFVLGACHRNPKMAEPDRLPPAPAPQTVELVARVQDCTEHERFTECVLVVDSVRRYGAGVTQLPAGTEIRASFRHGLKATDGTEAAELLNPSSALSLTLRFQRQTDPSTEFPSWQAVSVSQ